MTVFRLRYICQLKFIFTFILQSMFIPCTNFFLYLSIAQGRFLIHIHIHFAVLSPCSPSRFAFVLHPRLLFIYRFYEAFYCVCPPLPFPCSRALSFVFVVCNSLVLSIMHVFSFSQLI